MLLPHHLKISYIHVHEKEVLFFWVFGFVKLHVEKD
jgi:hypothetical protein